MAGCISGQLLSKRRLAAALLAGVVCSGASVADSSSKVTSVRFWSLGDVTRVAIEVSSDFKYRHDRLNDPDRLFFDIQGAKPATTDRKIQVIPVGDALIKQIRVAETQPGITRVVLDLEPHDPRLQFTASQLSLPNRLMVEVSLKDKPTPPVSSTSGGAKTVADDEAASVRQEPRKFLPPPEAFDTPVTPPARVQAKPALLPAPVIASVNTQARPPALAASISRSLPPPVPLPVTTTPAAPKPGPEPLPARHSGSGDQSLTRVLGLKLGRVVIDPGHGGHDNGTHGPSGLTEKEVVLDVAQRLGKLLEDRLGSEVVYTRDDDTFIPLEERTRIANDHKADLFLSIHANSSPVRSVTGVETYYLNFTTSKSAMEVAARENAGSQSSIFDLHDVLEKIALKDKVDESREFASRIQNALFAIAARNSTAVKNRGVKKAPFVVLIGASMPSVLAEIGFLTNASDETLLRKPEQRQKIAEALYKGIESYADGLSHFQVAKRE